MNEAVSPSQPKAIFISHAAPEDNEIAKWLTLRLMREGYSVWCDLERLRVGDDFWREIESRIRNDSAKFILLLSKISVARTGVLNELSVADKTMKIRGKRFILPIRADDLSFDNFPIQANRLDAADFSKSWSDGLGRILQILEEDSVPKNLNGATAVAQWWKNRLNGDEEIKQEREEYISNRYRISTWPKKVYLHSLNNLKPFEAKKFKPAFAVHKHAGLFVSFATAEDLRPAFMEADADIGNFFSVKFEDFLANGLEKPKVKPKEARNIIIHLLRRSFEGKLTASGLKPYEIANHSSYFWFPNEVIAPRKQVQLVRPNQTKVGRALVGAKKLKSREGTQLGTQGWHFGIEVIPSTWPTYSFYIASQSLGWTKRLHLLTLAPRKINPFGRSERLNWSVDIIRRKRILPSSIFHDTANAP